jgi:hypothetical protein
MIKTIKCRLTDIVILGPRVKCIDTHYDSSEFGEYMLYVIVGSVDDVNATRVSQTVYESVKTMERE